MKSLPLVAALAASSASLAQAQPERAPVPGKVVKLSAIKLPPSLSVKSQPMPPGTREALRDSLASALKVQASKLAPTVKPASGQLSDPTGLDVGTSVRFAPHHWDSKVSSRGTATSSATYPQYIAQDAIFLSASWKSRYTMQVSLPSLPTSQPQAYTLECELVSGYMSLPDALGVRVYVSARSGQALQSESLGPVAKSSAQAQTGWLSFGTIVPPGPYAMLSLVISVPPNGADAVVRQCELARVH